MHVFRFLCLLFSQLLCCSSSSNQFETVESCPESSEQWINREQRKNCRQFQATPDFMCAAIEGQPGIFGEICTVVGLSTAGKCAVLDADTYNLNFISCYASPGCPTTAYRASDIYKYQACFGNFYRVQSTTPYKALSTLHANRNSTIDDSTSNEQNAVTVVIVTLLVYVLILLILILFWVQKKRRKTEHSKSSEKLSFLDPKKDADKDPAEALKCMTSLANYLRCRLVALCDETSLRNKLLLHSESIKQNFEENTVNKLMKSTLSELSKSSLNIIYMVLTNFCDIPTPGRGWDYKPDDDDESLGADIERIRSFINEYVDTKRCYPKEMKMLKERLLSQYEEIEFEMDLDFSREQKINYVKIKPDCVEDDGTVVTKTIVEILKHLETKGIAICVGSIGCGKTTALEYVSKKYRKEGWQIECCDNFNFVEKSRVDAVLTARKTVLFCDNLFGTFGCQVFSKQVFRDFEYVIRTLLNQDKNKLKILLGIHVHVLDEIKSIGCGSAFQDKSRIIELDNLSKSEILHIYQLQQERSHRNQKRTTYKDVLDILEYSSDSIGKPFQTLMITTLPSEMERKAICNQPLEQLIDHFKKLFYRDSDAFFSLVFIMCVMVYNKNKDIDDSVAGAIRAYLDKNTIDSYLKELTPFTLEDEYTVELKHELIGIALFHVFFEISKGPWSVFAACDIKMALELTRPAMREEFLQHSFAVRLSEELRASNSVASILRKKILESKIDYEDHPLLRFIPS
ncbi:uncharacterized protein LOC134277945 [Saccostrea cucullata]|uniref:uncharacterized protein LOC134277945 n=1 Tax=Saccostrea cuccullata TaxID=36930 RepID=UPI002ED50B29